jgi:hypothetical protein
MIELNNVIQRSAFEMFRDWTKLALKRYPNMDFTIIDETILVNDTKDCIKKALKSLFSSKYAEERRDRYWSIGFVEGFVKGNLSVGWFYEYYQKQTDNYRNMIAFKSILEYLRIDPDLNWRLDAIYKEFFKSRNLDQIEFLTQIDRDFLGKYSLPTISNAGIVKQLLDNLVVMFIKKLNDEPPLKFPNKEYFSNEEILYFIQNRQKIWRES